MNRIMKLAGIGLLCAAGAAGAGTLEGMAAWAAEVGREAASNRLVWTGVSDPATVAQIMDGWEESVLVERALEAGAYRLLWQTGMRRDRLGPQSVARICAALQAGMPQAADQKRAVFDLMRFLPLDARREIAPVLYALVPETYTSEPVYRRKWVKHSLIGGHALFSRRTAAEDLVTVLLAPEALELRNAQLGREALRDAAVVLARGWLRDAGQSFVLRDGINPLTEAVRPVVEALNAPGGAGLEAALRALGAQVPDQDRAALEAQAAQWQAEILSGERAGREMNSVLGKLSVALGVEAFNAFVETYNHGAGDGAGDRAGDGDEAR